VRVRGFKERIKSGRARPGSLHRGAPDEEYQNNSIDSFSEHPRKYWTFECWWTGQSVKRDSKGTENKGWA